MTNLNVMHIEKNDENRVKVNGYVEQFHIWGSAVDYVEETSELMQQFAKHCFQFPFYVHVETYSDQESVQEMLAFQAHVDMMYRSTGNKVLSMTGGKILYEDVPSFSLKVKDAKDLVLVFGEWFHLAHQNHLWVMSQQADVRYEEGILQFDLTSEAVVLVADHDGYGFSVLTNAEEYREKAKLLAVFGE